MTRTGRIAALVPISEEGQFICFCPSHENITTTHHLVYISQETQPHLKAEVGEVAHGERGDKEHTRIQFVFIKDIG